MKAREARRILKALERGLAGVGACDVAARVCEFSELFEVVPKGTIEDLVRVMAAVTAGSLQVKSSDAKVSQAVEDILAFEPLFGVMLRPAAAREISKVLTGSSKLGDMTIRDLIAAMKLANGAGAEPFLRTGETLVDAFVRRLGETVDDREKFRVVFDALKADDRLNKAALVEIASAFAYPMAKSTSGKLALERIWKQHAASETAAAKSRAMRGRSAA